MYKKIMLSLVTDLREQQAVSENLSDEEIAKNLLYVIENRLWTETLKSSWPNEFSIATGLEIYNARRYPFTARLVKGLMNYHFYASRMLAAFASEHTIPSKFNGTIAISPEMIKFEDSILGTVFTFYRQLRHFKDEACRPWAPAGPIHRTHLPAIPNFRM